MSPTFLSTLALLFVSFTQNAYAGWRIEGIFLLTARMDPLVSPGGIASHVHNVVGGNNFTTTYDYDALRQSSCTTIDLPDDKSNYWMPAVYYKHRENGTLELVPSEFGVYYLHRGTETNIQRFPKGFRMIAGDPNRSTMTDSDKDKAIQFMCLDNEGINNSTYTFPPTNCARGFLMHIIMPSCWNGKDVSSPNFKDHVSYPVGAIEGNTCPPTHPIRLMTLRLEQIIHSENYEYYDGGFILSTGDNVGYSSHGDFANGWDDSEDGLLQQAINTCRDPKDHISECAVLRSLYDPDFNICRPAHNMPIEDVGYYGGLKQLPGLNPIWGGNVTKVITGVPNAVPFGSPFTTLPSNWEDYGCIGGVGHYMTGDTLVDPYMYPGLCIKYCDNKGFSLAGLEAGNTCYCANELTNGGSMFLMERKVCSTVCPGSRYEFCGWDTLINLYNKTGDTPNPPNGPVYPPAGGKIDQVFTVGG